MSRTDFELRLTKLINEQGMELASDTPDYILAHYLMRCLDAFNLTVADRECWGRKPPEGAVLKTPKIGQ